MERTIQVQKWRRGLLLAILPLFFGCSAPSSQEKSGNPSLSAGDTLIRYNQAIVNTENQEIEDFISRYSWKMTKTETGLRIMIYSGGKGKKAKTGDKVSVKYSLKKLSGDLVDPSEPLREEDFVLGRSQTISGLEEGILLMHEKDRARMIVPSHLAFGLLGDFHNITGRCVLVYDIELVSVF